MSLFTNINPLGDTSTIEAAGHRIAEGLLALPAPRSLAELRLSSDDYDWLLAWAGGASPGTVRRWLVDRTRQLSLSNLTRQDAVGLLLFTLATEVARRDAAEGQLWSSVAKRFGPAKSVLFVQGQPTYEHKAAFEGVAARFQLRNVFGLAGTQNWYVSTYLQFGFTRRGIEQLPMWLAGHPLTESIQDLLHDQARQSVTFRKLFDDLRLYRKDNITLDTLRRTVAASPWVLPEWTDRLVEAAREKMHLGAGSGGIVDSEDAVRFVGTPRLTWTPGHRPVIHLSLEHLAQLLSDGTYHVEVSRERVGVVISDLDLGVTGDTEVEVPMRAPAVTVTIRQAEDGSPVCSQEVSFWDAGDDVSAYDLVSGKQIDPWNDAISAERAYALILADDLEASPAGASFGLAMGHRIHYVAAHPDKLEVRLDGAILWEPLAPGANRAPQPGWLRDIRVTTIPRDEPVTVGQSLRLQLNNLEGDLRFLRLGSTPMNFTQEEGYGVSEAFEVMPHHLGAPTIVSTGIEHEGQLRVRRLPLELDGSGALLLTDDGWAPMGADDDATVTAIESSRVKLIWRAEDRPAVAGLGVMAGSTFIRRAWDGTAAIRGVPGYGARLEIRRPYNPIGSEGITLAASVIDPGIIVGVDLGPDAVDIELSSPIEPDAEHQCVIVDASGNAHLTDCSMGPDPQHWSAPLCAMDVREVAAVAIAYRGRRIGAAFLEGLDALLLDAIHGDTSSGRVAALSRWLHVPVLAPRFRSKFERLTADVPCEVLGAWLTNHELPTELVHDVSEEWYSTLRSFYLQLRGSMKREALGRLWTALREYDPRDESLAPLDLLDEVSPFMFLRGLQWIAMNKLAKDKASIGMFLWGSTIDAVMATSLAEAAAVMQVDENFLKTGVAKPYCEAIFDPSVSLEGWQWKNVETCLSVAAFRRYACARVLKEWR